MDRFLDQLDTWFQEAGAFVGDGIGLIQRYVIIAIAVIVVLTGLAYVLGFIPMRFFERMKHEWLGSIVVGGILIFGVGTILVAMLP